MIVSLRNPASSDTVHQHGQRPETTPLRPLIEESELDPFAQLLPSPHLERLWAAVATLKSGETGGESTADDAATPTITGITAHFERSEIAGDPRGVMLEGPTR